MRQADHRRPQRRLDIAGQTAVTWALLAGLAAGFSVPGLTWAAGPPDTPAVADRGMERSAIDIERRRVEASFDAAKAACQGRFLLNQCLDEARTTQRLALDKLQRRQLTLDDAERRERSTLRLRTLQAWARELARATASSATASMPASRGLTVRRVERATAVPHPPAVTATTATGARPSAAAASAQARRNQAAFLQRQQQATAHRAAVLERNARQDASKSPAAGLPVPGAVPASH